MSEKPLCLPSHHQRQFQNNNNINTQLISVQISFFPSYQVLKLPTMMTSRKTHIYICACVYSELFESFLSVSLHVRVRERIKYSAAKMTTLNMAARTCLYVYIYICVCVCVCVKKKRERETGRFLPHNSKSLLR